MNLFMKRKEDRQEFLLNAEELKKKLSTHSIVKRKIKEQQEVLQLKSHKKDFERKISSYISRTELLVEQVLDESEMEASSVIIFYQLVVQQEFLLLKTQLNDNWKRTYQQSKC